MRYFLLGIMIILVSTAYSFADDSDSLQGLSDTGYASDTLQESYSDTISELQSMSSFITNFMQMKKVEERLGILEIGANFFPNGKTTFAKYYQVSNPGVELSLYFPFHIPTFSSYFRFTYLYHSTVKEGNLFPLLTGMNELLFGKQFPMRKYPFVFLPLLGFGLNNTIVVNDFSSGIFHVGDSHYFLFWDLGLQVLYPMRLGKQDCMGGLSIHLQRAFIEVESTDTQFMTSLFLAY